MPLRTSLGIVWGSEHIFSGVLECHAVLPAKTSQWCIQFNGSPPSVSSACSQVSFTTSVVNSSVLLTFVAVTLSLVSLSLIARSHLLLISSLGSCMTLLHLSTHTRYADSESSICRRRDGPGRGTLLVRLSSFLSCTSACRLMQPQPRMMPRFILGHGMSLCGQRLRAMVHINCVVSSLHWVRMCSIDSVTLQVLHWQISLSS